MTYGSSDRYNGTAVRQTGRASPRGKLLRRSSSLASAMRLWRDNLRAHWRVAGGETKGVPVRAVKANARPSQDSSISSVGGNEGSLYETLPPTLRPIRWAGDNGLRRLAEVRDLRRLGVEQRLSGQSSDRPEEQRSWVFSRQLPLRHGQGKYGKPLVLAAAFALAGCVGTPVVTTNAAACSTLLPDDWKKGVAGAPLPEGDTVGDWVAFADAQTGKLDQANSRTKDAIENVERCEARDARAVRRASRGFFGRLFG
jgi:hypothetical protein